MHTAEEIEDLIFPLHTVSFIWQAVGALAPINVICVEPIKQATKDQDAQPTSHLSRLSHYSIAFQMNIGTYDGYALSPTFSCPADQISVCAAAQW